MAKKSPNLPNTPQYFEDPVYKQGIDRLFGLGNRLTNFDFSGTLSPLAETISTSPEMTTKFLEGLRLEMDPIMTDTRQDIINQLAANNQLQSSTTANKLLQTQQRYEQGFQQAATQFGIADIERALRNRISLFGTGLDVTSGATQMAGQRSATRNQFNLANYENEVAKVLHDQGDKKGGLFGGLTGAAGGALLGVALAPFTGGLSMLAVGAGALGGGALGALGPEGTGMGILQGGAGAVGMPSALPGSTAGVGSTFRGGLGNDGASQLSKFMPSDSSLLTKYPWLMTAN